MFQAAFEQFIDIENQPTETPANVKETETTNSSNDANNPKYLEILCDDNEEEPISSPYEIPLSDLSEKSSFNSSKISIAQNEDDNNLELRNQSEPIKERTLSSSSTVSEASVYCPKIKQSQQNDNDSTTLTPNMILTVALPNTIQDCTSNEKLLAKNQFQCPTAEKLRQLCNDSKTIESVLTYDGITSM